MKRLRLIFFLVVLTSVGIWAQTSDEVTDLISRATSLYEEENYRNSATVAREALQISEKVHGRFHPSSSVACSILARCLEELEDPENAELYYRRALEIDTQLYGSRDSRIESSLYDMARFYRIIGDYESALPLYERVLSISEEAYGSMDPRTASALSNLSNAYIGMERYEEGSELLERAIEIDEQTLEPNDPAFSVSYNNLGYIYKETGRYSDAVPVLQHALKLRQNEPGTTEADLLVIYRNLAESYLRSRDFSGAAILYEKIVRLDEKLSGPEHFRTADSVNMLAITYDLMDLNDKALENYKRAYRINLRTLGPDHSATLTAKENIAQLYEELGTASGGLRESTVASEIEAPPESVKLLCERAVELHAAGEYKEARSLFQRALSTLESNDSSSPSDKATILNNLALTEEKLGNYQRATVLFERSLEIKETTHGASARSTLTTLQNLAALHIATGDYEKALVLASTAAEQLEKYFGPEDSDTLNAWNTLGLAYANTGDYEKAVALQTQILAQEETVYGVDHLQTATSLNNLAHSYSLMGDVENALLLHRRALDVRIKELGATHPLTGESENNVGLASESVGDYDAALRHYENALRIFKEVYGPGHQSVATAISNLAGLHSRVGNRQEALSFAHQSLELDEATVGPEHPNTATSLDNLGQEYRFLKRPGQAVPLLLRALAIREKVLGAEHPLTVESFQNMAMVYIEAALPTKALDFAEKAASGELEVTSNVFTFASERQRLAYQEKHRPYDLFATLESGPNLIRQALRYKGLVLDSMVEDLRLAEASEDPATRELLTEIGTTKNRLLELVFDSSVAEVDRAKENELKLHLERLQSRLAREGLKQVDVRRAFAVTPGEVQESMPQGSVLVEFLRYSHQFGAGRRETRYGAVVLPKEGEAIWTPLPGEARDQDARIALYRALVRGAQGGGRFVLETDSGESTGPEASLILAELYESLWAPVERNLPPETKTIIVSPDGDINFVSFATLITPQSTFLAEEYEITYVSSGRDLLASEEVSPNRVHLLVGNPDFAGDVASKGTNLGISRTLEPGEWGELNFPPLPYTLVECEALQKFYLQKKEKVVALLGESATETRVREIQSPQTVHLATHGFFLPEPEAEQKDPMFRSGLALAGAQTTVKLRAEGDGSDMRNDGLLTAAEVGTLNLKGTRLVTLSACDTGSGEARAGEGVLGLRRGFVQAGARNLIMTLWPVADKETAQLMQDFYAAAESMPAPLAMAEVQRRWLTTLRKEKSLAEAVRLAGPFVLSFQGRIE